MRTRKRFTPAMLNRWEKQGRGTGSGADYQPWHQVTRSDPSSRGRSHLLYLNNGRLAHLLSDAEYVAFAFATMCSKLIEVREQFKLPTECGVPEEHGEAWLAWAEGTQVIASDLGVRHPRLQAGADRRLWCMTSDLVLTLGTTDRPYGLMAVAVKYAEELRKPRVLELLSIEREYWRRRGARWLLLTPGLYSPLAKGVLSAGMPWVIDRGPPPKAHLDACRELAPGFAGQRIQVICMQLQQHLAATRAEAMAAFWGSVWAGSLPLDLSQAWRSDQPVRFVSDAGFVEQNPIASGRSAWLD